LFIENIFGSFKTGEKGPGRFSKALGAAMRNLLSKRRIKFEPANFKSIEN
jgi:hypothetical protein